jgi:hypothetical protein
MRPKFVLYFQMVMVFTGLALVAAGCAQTGDVPGASDVASVTDTSLTDADIGGETFVPAPCAPVSGDPTLLRLKGTVWTGDVLLPEGEVFVSATTGLVLCVSEDCSDVEGADAATVVCTDGIITPGLVNPHDHANYNHLPRWQHVKRYKNRYEWQADSTYHAFKAPQSETFYKAKCETMKWAELRGLVSGTTAMQGTSGGTCIQGWTATRSTRKSPSCLAFPTLPSKSGRPPCSPARRRAWSCIWLRASTPCPAMSGAIWRPKGWCKRA